MSSKQKKYAFLLMSLFLIIVTLVTFSFFNFKDNNEMEIHINKTTKDYKIDISYPITPVSSINNKIKIMINNYRTRFLSTLKHKEKNTKIYNLSIDYNIEKYNEIYFIHFKIHSCSEENNYINNITYYYNSVINKELFLTDLFKEDEFSKLSSLIYQETFKYILNDDMYKSEEWLSISANKNILNYNNLSLTHSGLKIMLPLYRKINFNTNPSTITIPYFKLIHVLKDKYLNTYKYDFSYKISTDKFKNKKIVALTFDDGPSYTTTNILLDELNKRKVKATFFIVGTNALNYPELVRKAYLSGHQIGSHTYSHKQLTRLNDYEIEEEITRNNEIIKNIIGEYPTLLRPPYGSFNDNIKLISDMYIILWNVDTLDWKNRNKEAVYNSIINEVSDGDIVLLHDLYPSTIEGVIMAIDELKKQGYEFVTIDEMIKLKKINFDKNYIYFSF